MARPKGANVNFTNVPRYEDAELKMICDESVNPAVLVISNKVTNTVLRIEYSKVNALLKMGRDFKRLIEQNEVIEVKGVITDIKKEIEISPEKTVAASAAKASDSKTSK